ncbi:unnamed protein product, partial [Protopolystoma xenopodis]
MLGITKAFLYLTVLLELLLTLPYANRFNLEKAGLDTPNKYIFRRSDVSSPNSQSTHSPTSRTSITNSSESASALASHAASVNFSFRTTFDQLKNEQKQLKTLGNPPISESQPNAGCVSSSEALTSSYEQCRMANLRFFRLEEVYTPETDLTLDELRAYQLCIKTVSDQATVADDNSAEICPPFELNSVPLQAP